LEAVSLEFVAVAVCLAVRCVRRRFCVT